MRRGDRLLKVHSEPFKPRTPLGSTASDRLSAIRPRVATTLDGAGQLRPAQSPSSLAFRRRTRARPEAKATSARLFRPRLKRMSKPLTLPCRPPRSPGRPRLTRRAEDRFPRPCVNKSGFPGPRAPFIDTCSAYFRRQRPPPIPRLCRRDPASGGVRLPMLSHGKARPSSIARALQPGVARTMRRVSTSAIKTIVEHNRLIDRTPLTVPGAAPEHSFEQTSKTARAASKARRTGGSAPFEARPAERSQVRGEAPAF